MVRATVLSVLAMAVAVAGWGVEAGDADRAGRCRALAEADDPLAVAACRDALSAQPGNVELQETLAAVEHRHGDPEHALTLWQSLLESKGWLAERARGEAMALWRTGRTAQAEAALRELVRRDPSVAAREDLIRFLLSFDRAEEAASEAESAAVVFPDRCEIQELWGEALSARADHAGAASHFSLAVELGCPPFRWTAMGTVPQNLDGPAYLALLRPNELVAGLQDLEESQVLRRFELLRHVMVSEAAPAVADQILGRRSPEIRLAGLGLLAAVGGTALDSWTRVLAADDLMLRKNALRRIGELRDPTFLSLLEAQLAREPLPGNRNLAALALGELLIDGIDTSRGRTLLEAIPEKDSSFPAARLGLSELAEQDGRYLEAVELLDEARAAGPGVWIDPEREMRLRSLAGVAPNPSIPSPAASPVPAPGVE